MKNIILPSDFSDNAWRAMCYAADLYHNLPCKFHILNTYTFPTTYAETGILIPIDPLREESEEQLERLLGQFKDLDHHELSEFETKSACGPLVDIIQNLEEDLDDTPMIVMGTKGVTSLTESLFGTITVSAIKRCKSPLICVPNKADLQTPEKIMFTMDDRLISLQNAIAPFLEIAEQWNSKVMTVHICDQQIAEGVKTTKEIVSDYYLDRVVEHSFHCLESENTEEELKLFAKSNNVDLIAMIRRDKGFWKNFFQPSLTKNMAFYADVPLLVLREN